MKSVSAGKPAFDMPGGEGARGPKGRPIDFDQLGRQTMGDRALEQEVLALFVHQATTMSDRMIDAGREERLRLAHTLKGSSRSVGAYPITECIEELERDPENASIVQRLRRRVNEAAEVAASINR